MNVNAGIGGGGEQGRAKMFHLRNENWKIQTKSCLTWTACHIKHKHCESIFVGEL